MDGFEQDTRLIRALVEYVGMKPAVVAREAGVAVTTINRPYTGTATSRLGRAAMEKLRARFPDFPGWADHLGVPSLSDTRIPYRHEGQAQSKSPSAPTVAADMVELEQIDLKFGMGGTYADGLVEVAKRPFSRAWLQTITSTSPRHLFWAIGDGDSMEPTIRSGEVLLIDRSEFSPRFDDSIWALVHGEIGMIKRLRMLPGGQVELHSDNQLVRPTIAVDGELHVIGRVIAVVRRL